MSEEAIENAAVDGPVLVIGTGLIGTSIALALSRAGIDVALEDADASALQEAVYRGAGSVLTDHEPSIVVVAVPPTVAASQMTTSGSWVAIRWPAGRSPAHRRRERTCSMIACGS